MHPITKVEDATAYVLGHFAKYGEKVEIVTAYSDDNDGAQIVKVVFTMPKHGAFPECFDVWTETRADGSTYIYGEW